MDAFYSGAWRSNIRRGTILLGGLERRFTRAEAYINGQWRTAARFLPPLTVSATPSVIGFGRSNRTVLVTSNTASATPTGGQAPYTYSWSIISGVDMTINSPTSAGTTFSANVPAFSDRSAVARVTCRDNVGNIATADVNVDLINESGN